MAGEVTIESLATQEDLDAVVALEADTFANPWTREMLVREITADVMRVYVLRTPERRVAAFCAYWFIVDEVHINTVAVDVALRRRGLARALLSKVLLDAAHDGAVTATLEVRRSNEAALRLYRQLGFVVEAVRPGYYTNPAEDALILWRRDLKCADSSP